MNANRGESITTNDMLYALADGQRRRLLIALLEDDSPLVIADSESAADSLEHRMSMKHVHLPKLADYGFIEWDRERHEVSKGPKFVEIRPLIELLNNHENELPDDWL